MRHRCAYLDWYEAVPRARFDFRSSGLGFFKYDLSVSDVDLSRTFSKGNPELLEVLAKRYGVKPMNVFVSSDGASGQNARVVRLLSEMFPDRTEAVVEFPTYEPLLRSVQEYFPVVKRLERSADDGFRLNSKQLRNLVSERTALLMVTNPHAPTGAVSGMNELDGIMGIAREFGFRVVCDEIYGEFDRDIVPCLFSVDDKLGVVTSSFTKAYGLGGVKVGVVLADPDFVSDLYSDSLYSVGCASNVAQLAALKLLTADKYLLDEHLAKWSVMRRETAEWLTDHSIEFLPNGVSVTFWVRLPVEDSFSWVADRALPSFDLVTVPGCFFLLDEGYSLARSGWARLGLGNIRPNGRNLDESLEVLGEALDFK